MIKMTTGEAVIIFLTYFKNVESGSIAPQSLHAGRNCSSSIHGGQYGNS